MIAFLLDYWPMLAVLAIAALSLWASEYLGYRRGYHQGRADVHREQRHLLTIRSLWP